MKRDASARSRVYVEGRSEDERPRHEARAMTRTGAWTWVGVLVALGGAALVVAAKRGSYFGSEVGSGHISNWVAMWGVTLLTLLILVVGERQPLSAIGFRRLTWASLGFGVALGAIV